MPELTRTATPSGSLMGMALGVTTFDFFNSPDPRQLAERWRDLCRDVSSLSIIIIPIIGDFEVHYQGRQICLGTGRAAILREAAPHEVMKTPEAELDLLQIVLPTQYLRSQLGCEIGKFATIDSCGPELQLITNIYRGVWQANRQTTLESQHALVDASMCLLRAMLRESFETHAGRRSIIDIRYDNVRSFISRNLSNQNLSVGMVADNCGISKRYLSFILHKQGTTFADLVWRSRMELARKWLMSSCPDEISVSEVSYACGFKSPAHFSRRFKRTYEVNPREVRLGNKSGSPRERAELIQIDFRAIA